MVGESKLFEQVVAYLFRTRHDVMIDCHYGGKTRPRKFGVDTLIMPDGRKKALVNLSSGYSAAEFVTSFGIF